MPNRRKIENTRNQDSHYVIFTKGQQLPKTAKKKKNTEITAFYLDVPHPMDSEFQVQLEILYRS